MTPEEFYYWNQQFGADHDKELDDWFADNPPIPDIVERTQEYTSHSVSFTHEDKIWLAKHGMRLE